LKNVTLKGIILNFEIWNMWVKKLCDEDVPALA
jgi:hypothetical protein